MAIEGLPPVANSASIFTPVSAWGARLVSPLGSSLMSKVGMIELAGKVYWFPPLVIVAVIVAMKCGYLTGRVAPTDSSSIHPTGISRDSPKLPRAIGEHPARDDVALPNPEVPPEDLIGNLPMMAGVMAGDARPVDEALFDVLAQRIERFAQGIEQRVERFEQVAQRIERMAQGIEQRVERIERVAQRIERMAQGIEQILVQRLELVQQRRVFRKPSHFR